MWTVQLPPKPLKLDYPFYIDRQSAKRLSKFRRHSLDGIEHLDFSFTKARKLQIRLDNVRAIAPCRRADHDKFVRHGNKWPCNIIKEDKAFIKSSKDRDAKMFYMDEDDDDFYKRLPEVRRVIDKLNEVRSRKGFVGFYAK